MWVAIKRFTFLLLCLSVLALVSCNSLQRSSAVETEELEPITLTIMMWNWGEKFDEYYKEYVEEAFPHITLEMIDGASDTQDLLEEALGANIIPDLIFAHRQNHVRLVEEYELGYDMTELIEKHDFDLSRYDPEHLQEWASWTDGEVWFLPMMRDRYALQYNKDVFDTFGVDYPVDGMTWSEVVDLAAKVTGTRDGIDYQGLHISHVAHFPLSSVVGNSQLIDPETDEVLWTDNPYVQEWLRIVERVHTMPGNEFPDGDWHAWAETRTLAMKPLWLDMGTPAEMNFDVVTYPEWDDAQGVGPYADGWAFGVTAASPHKDEAFKVLQHIYSDENMVHLGDTPLHAPYTHVHEGLKTIEMLDSENEREAKFIGKNLESLFIQEASGGPETRSKYDIGALSQIENYANDFLESEMDVNSFLREMKEKEEIRIQDEKGRE